MVIDIFVSLVNLNLNEGANKRLSVFYMNAAAASLSVCFFFLFIFILFSIIFRLYVASVLSPVRDLLQTAFYCSELFPFSSLLFCFLKLRRVNVSFHHSAVCTTSLH